MEHGSRGAEGAFKVAALASGFWASLWVLGTNGFGFIHFGSLPNWINPVAAYGTNNGWASSPVWPAIVRGQEQAEVTALYDKMNGFSEGGLLAPDGFGEILPAAIVQFQDVSFAQRVCFVSLEVLACVAVALIALTLARMVASSRTDSPFNATNVLRLRVIGVLLLVGAPLLSVAQWVVMNWIAQDSSVADRVRFPGYHWFSLPLWAMAVGAAVLVLADVWRRGVRMTHDVSGLV